VDDRETSDDREPYAFDLLGSSREVHPLRTHYASRELMVARCVGMPLHSLGPVTSNNGSPA